MMSELEDKIKLELLEKLMSEMDESVGSRLKKKPDASVIGVEIEAEPMMEEEAEVDGDELAMDLGEEESPEDKLKRRIEALRKKG